MAFFKVTLIRSAIGLPAKTRKVLSALKLYKRMATVFHPVNQATAGQILRVKELVKVTEVERALTPAEMKATRTPDSGYVVEKMGMKIN